MLNALGANRRPEDFIARIRGKAIATIRRSKRICEPASSSHPEDTTQLTCASSKAYRLLSSIYGSSGVHLEFDLLCKVFPVSICPALRLRKPELPSKRKLIEPRDDTCDRCRVTFPPTIRFRFGFVLFMDFI